MPHVLSINIFFINRKFFTVIPFPCSVNNVFYHFILRGYIQHVLEKCYFLPAQNLVYVLPKKHIAQIFNKTCDERLKNAFKFIIKRHIIAKNHINKVNKTVFISFEYFRNY